MMKPSRRTMSMTTHRQWDENLTSACVRKESSLAVGRCSGRTKLVRLEEQPSWVAIQQLLKLQHFELPRSPRWQL